MSPRRLDVALHEDGHARSRTHARRIIEEGRALVDGRSAGKPSLPVPEGSRVEVIDVPDGVEYASRAAHKLAGALTGAGVEASGRTCLDAGASTGGFTDVLLRRGAHRVIAVDIGHDQLAPHLREDPRVDVRDGTSIRGLRPESVGGPVDLLVADLSFISLRTVIADLAGLVSARGELLVMVKPQFEVGRARLPRSGVVVSAEHRVDALRGVVEAAAEAGLELRGAGMSALPGQDGNREYFLHLRPAPVAAPVSPAAYDMIDQAVRHPSAPRTTPEGGERTR